MFPRSSQRAASYLEDAVKLAEKGEQCGFAQGDPPQILLDGILPKRYGRGSVHGGRPYDLAHSREHQGLTGAHCGAAFFSGGSGPSSSGRLRHSTKGGFHCRHLRDRHLTIARHLMSLRKKEGEARDGKQETEKELWGLELDGSPFIGPFRSTYPTTL